MKRVADVQSDVQQSDAKKHHSKEKHDILYEHFSKYSIDEAVAICKEHCKDHVYFDNEQITDDWLSLFKNHQNFRKIIIRLIDDGIFNLCYIPGKLKNDKEFVLKIIKTAYMYESINTTWSLIGESLKKDHDIIMKCIILSIYTIEELDEETRIKYVSDPEVMELVIRKYGTIDDVDIPHIKNNNSLFLNFLKVVNGWDFEDSIKSIFKDMGSEFKEDSELIKQLINIFGIEAIKWAKPDKLMEGLGYKRISEE